MKITWTPKCGKHKIVIIVTKTVSNDWAGLVFSLDQDQSKCKCNSNGWWNPYKCRCECLNECECPSNKIWKGYPYCACKCKPRTSNPGSISGTLVIQAVSICPRGQFWSEKDCKCMCKPRWCPDGWYYNQSPTANGECKCWPAIP